MTLTQQSLFDMGNSTATEGGGPQSGRRPPGAIESEPTRELDFSTSDVCPPNVWPARVKGEWCVTLDTWMSELAYEGPRRCRYVTAYARGNELVIVTPIGEPARFSWQNKTLVEWPREQRRDEDNSEQGEDPMKREEACEVISGDIEACLRLIRGRGFSVAVATPARTADDVVRRRRPAVAVGAWQPAIGCFAPQLTALAA